jgi:hypothetical protein
MKKFAIDISLFLCAIVVLGAIGIRLVAGPGNQLDKESKAYADAAIPAIVAGWNDKELLDRGSPEFKRAATQKLLDQTFYHYRRLGRLKKCEPAQRQAGFSATAPTDKAVTAQYTAKATFENGQATITLDLIKHADQWQVRRFVVNSPAVTSHP